MEDMKHVKKNENYVGNRQTEVSARSGICGRNVCGMDAAAKLHG